MGLTAENVANRYRISRQQQDEFSLLRHQRAIAALEVGRFNDQIVPVPVDITEAKNGKVLTKSFVFQRDEGPRQDTTLEALAKLRPAFKDGGTVTAGNSSQMSDGAAAVMIMSHTKANELGIVPLARFISFAVGGVPPEIMGDWTCSSNTKSLKNCWSGIERYRIN